MEEFFCDMGSPLSYLIYEGIIAPGKRRFNEGDV
jgi:hypothetical protein